MAKQINVDLNVRANTQEAKKAFNDLQHSLQQIQALPQRTFNDTSLKNASKAAGELQLKLQQAVNVDTGKLDLSRFSSSLAQSGHDLNYFKENLNAMGPLGQRAFLKLSESIATADASTLRLGARMDQFLTALKNTARWQISSSVLHGLMGALSSAYGYAQDLNKSLNDIRIVTGQSEQQMATFAEQANKSAQALNASTLAYTNAALIYYQQGLGDKQVKDMTDITVKMSNVTGESAEDVSSYMTAIWNNFNDGSATLESFADKIVALGAATASSSEEIANGLQKFASLGSSLGLSYDDATAALATVVAQTRQSADTVGNSFRTLFQRIESLKQGETEDGVDLTKYSEALEKVGVQVLKGNGDLRDMHDVLMDLGSAWQGLSKAQQQALAQTVGGVRNSNTLIALMDNFDKFQENLATAENAEGALDKQADIYAESWEAAQKRVRASLQSVYQDLIDDKFFIQLTNVLDGLVKGIDKAIDGFGGLLPIVTTIGRILMQQYSKEIPSAMKAVAQNLKIVTGKGKQEANKLLSQNSEALDDSSSYTVNGRESEELHNKRLGLRVVNDMNKKLVNHGNELTAAERAEYEMKIQQVKDMTDQATQAGINADEAKKSANNIANDARRKMIVAGATKKEMSDFDTKRAELQENYKNFYEAENVKNSVNSIQELYRKLDKSKPEETEKIIKQLKEEMKALGDVSDETAKKLNLETDALKDLRKVGEETDVNQDDLKGIIKGLGEDAEEAQDKLLKKNDAVGDFIAGLASREAADKMQEAEDLSADTANDSAQYRQGMEGIGDEEPKHVMALSEAWGNVGASIMQVVSVMGTAKNLIDTLSDPDTSNWDKLAAVMGLVANMTMTLNTLFSVQNVESIKTIGLKAGEVAARLLNKTAIEGENAALVIHNSLMLTGLATGAAVIAAALAVGAVIFALVKAYNADKDAAEAAAKQAEKSKQAYDEVRQSFEDLKSSLQDYDDSVDALKNLKEGTEEWDEAVQKINDHVLDLLSKYPELAKYVSEVDGHLSISQEGQNELYKEQLTEVNKAQYKAMYDTQNKNITDTTSDTTDLARSIFYTNSSKEQKTTTTSTSNALDSANNTSAPPVGTVSKEDLNAVIEAYQQNSEVLADANVLMKETGIKSKDEAEALIKNAAEIANLSDRMEANSKAQESSVRTIAAQGVKNETGDTLNQVYDNEADRMFAQNYMADSVVENTKEGDADSYAEQLTKATQDFFQQITDEEGKVTQETAQQYLDIAKQTVFERAANASQAAADKLNGGANGDDVDLTSGAGAGPAKGFTSDQIEDWYNGLSDDQKTLFFNIDFDKVTTEDNLDDVLDEAFAERSESLAQTASSVKELNDLWEQGKLEVEDFNNAYLNLYEAEEEEDLDPEKWEDFSDYLQDAADESDDLADSLEDNDDAAKIVAKSIMRMNDGIGELADNWDTWGDVLANSSKSSEEYADAMRGTREAVADLLDTSTEFVSRDFVADHLDLIKEAATGDEDAIESLRAACLEDIVAKIVVDNKLDADAQAQLTNSLTNLQSMLDANPLWMETGAEVDDTDFINATNEMIKNAHLTAEQVNAMFDQMGFEANFASEGQPVQTMIPEYTTYHSIEPGVKVTFNKGTKNEETVEGWTERSYTEQTGQHVAEGLAASYAMTTDGTVPKIKSVTRKAPASMNNYSSANKGGGPPGRGSGGGGGSSKPKKPQTKEHKENKEAKDEIERYHEINKVIEDTTAEVDKFGKAADRTYGKNKVDQFNNKLRAQEKLLANNNQKLAEAQRYLESDRNAIAAYGATFDAEGNISNYTSLMQNELNKYNSAVAAYNRTVDAYNANNSDETEAAVEAADKELNAAEKRYDAFKKTLSRYEETEKLTDDLTESIRNLNNEIFDGKLEITKYKVEVNVDVVDDQLDLLDWQLKHLGKDADTANDRIANLGEQLAKNAESIKEYEGGLAEIFSRHNLNGTTAIQKLISGDTSYFNGAQFTNDEWEAIKDYRNKIMDAQNDMADKFENVHEIVKDTIDELEKDFEKITKQFDKYQKKYESLLNTINVLGKKTLGITTKDIVRLNQAMVDNALNVQRVAQDSIKTSQKFVLEAKAAYDRAVAAGNETAIKAAKETLDQAQEMLEDAQEQALESQADTLEKAQDAYEAYWENIRDDYQSLMGGQSGMDLDYLSDVFDRQKDINDMYLEDYEKYHELNALNSQIDKDMAAGLTTKMQSKYNDLLDDINAKMKDGAKISATEAETFKKRLAYLQAEAQLEDAKTAKTAVRMTRDNEGNFSYTYTADQNAIDAAEESVNNAAFDYIDYQRKYELQMNEAALDVMQEYYDKIEEVTKKYQNDPSRLATAKAEVEQYYKEKLEYYLSEDKMIMSDMQRFRDDDLKDYEDMNNQKIASDESFITDFSQTILSQLLGYQTLEEVMTNFANGQSMVSESSANAIAQFVANTQASLATSGQSATKFAGDLTKTIEDTTQQSNETAVEAMQFDKVMNDQIQSVMDKTEEFDNLWSKKMNNMRDNTEKLVESLNKLSEAAGSMTYDANSDAIGAGASGTRDLTGSSGADKRNIDTYQGILDRLNDNNYAQNRNNKLDALNESTLGTSVLNSIMDKVYASIDAMSNYMQANTAIGTVGSGLNNNGTLEQNVHIEASFPNVSSHNEIEEAFSNLLNSTSQFINRK